MIQNKVLGGFNKQKGKRRNPTFTEADCCSLITATLNSWGCGLFFTHACKKRRELPEDDLKIWH